MKHSNFVDRQSRRNALKGMAVLGGAAIVSGAATSASAAESDTRETIKQPKSLGYRETAHVREYYKRARF